LRRAWQRVGGALQISGPFAIWQMVLPLLPPKKNKIIEDAQESKTIVCHNKSKSHQPSF
jgi:hypothetical protein